MRFLVTDDGLHPDDWSGSFAALGDLPGEGPLPAVDLIAPLTDAARNRLMALLPDLRLIRIRLRHFADTEGLTLARMLNAAGYRGRLRAQGAVLARDWPLLRRSGFSEVALTLDQFRRQPPEHWTFQPLPGTLGVPFQGQPA